jgi:hypothetical protein
VNYLQALDFAFGDLHRVLIAIDLRLSTTDVGGLQFDPSVGHHEAIEVAHGIAVDYATLQPYNHVTAESLAPGFSVHPKHTRRQFLSTGRAAKPRLRNTDGRARETETERVRFFAAARIPKRLRRRERTRGKKKRKSARERGKESR